MPKRLPPRDPLALRVCTELGRGRITEGCIKGEKEHLRYDGYIDSGHITINPTHDIVDTLVHELLHRLYPAWTERYVRSRTKRLLNSLSDAEVQTIYDEYQIQVRYRKSTKVIEEDE